MFGRSKELYFICYITIISTQDALAKVDPKSVNLELETSLQFDPKDRTNNHSIADIKNFITRLQSLLNPIKAMLEPNKIKMSYLFENLAMRVNKYDDKDFARLGRIVIKELDEHINNNKNLSALLGDKYRAVMQYINENPNAIRTQTRKSTNNKNYKAIKVLISKLDKYYDDNDVKKMKNIIVRLKHAPKRNENLRTLVKDTLDTVVFDKYKKLNNTVKSKLFNELLKIQRYFKMKISRDNKRTLFNNENVSKYVESSELSGQQLSKEEKSINYVNDTHDSDIILNKNIEILIENDDLKSE